MLSGDARISHNHSIITAPLDALPKPCICQMLGLQHLPVLNQCCLSLPWGQVCSQDPVQVQPELGVLCPTTRPPQRQHDSQSTAGWAGWAAACHGP